MLFDFLFPNFWIMKNWYLRVIGLLRYLFVWFDLSQNVWKYNSMQCNDGKTKRFTIFQIVRTKLCLHLRKCLTQFFSSTERGLARSASKRLSRAVSRSADARLRRKNKIRQNRSLKKTWNCVKKRNCVLKKEKHPFVHCWQISK